MASTYSSLKIQLMATGENSGTWGNVTNINLGTALEEAIVGSANVAFSSADVTLTLANTNQTQTARNLRLNLTGTSGGNRNLIVPAIEKIYIINNGLANQVTVKNATGTGIVVPAGKTMYVYNDGTNVVDAITHLTSLTLGSPLPVASGGTGSTTAAFSGANITSLNASNISSGTIANARTTASSANGANSIVTRDASGNFSANTVTANLTGTAANATVLQTARTIGISGGATGTATSFNGGANITIPVTGLNASTINAGTIANARTTASSSNGANSIVLRDASGNFSANTITASLSGNASSATNATNATNVAVTTSATASAFKVPFANTTASTTGNYGLLQDSTATFTYNPSTNVLTVGTVSGNLSGNATTATTATTATNVSGGSVSTTGVTSSGNIIPSTDNTGAVGNSTNTWNSGHFTNMTVDSTLSVRAAIDLADNDILRFGSSDDAEFFFNGTNFYLDLNLGDFIIRDGTTTRYTFDDNGQFTATGTITAPTFSGALSGNATTATTLQTARTINGTSFNGSANITTANWGTSRTLTIGDTGKSVNGSGNVAWTLDDISPETNAYATTGVGMRNRIINGDMRIDQRNNGASVSAVDSGFPIDRWKFAASPSAKFNGQRNAGAVTPPVGFTNYLGATSTSAYSVASGDYQGFQQRIEGFNVADLAWGTANAAPITISFWVRSSLTGTFGGSLYNNAANRSYPFTFTISAANTWEQKTFTVQGDTSGTWTTDNSAGLTITFGLGVGTTYSGTAGAWAGALYFSATGATSVVGTSGATFYITGVQLEKGSVATPFERRPYGTELALCERYYEVTYGGCRATGYGGIIASGVNFRVLKRVNPTVTFLQSVSLENTIGNPFASSPRVEGFEARCVVSGNTGSFSAIFTAGCEL